MDKINSENQTLFSKGSWLLIVLIFLVKLFYIILFPRDLSPEEAYYWTYSIYPAMGYFDHPPMIAFIILFFTKLFGTSECAIRLGAVILSLLTNIFLYLSAQKLFNRKIAFFSILLLNLSFVFSLYSIFITPDSPLFFFWTLSFFIFLKGTEKEQWYYWLLLGISTGLAILSKYNGIFIPVSLFIFCYLYKPYRKFLLHIALASGIAILIFSPVIIWNMDNGFASFLFQSSSRFTGKSGNLLQNTLGFWLLQGLYFTPLFLIAYINSSLFLLSDKNKSYKEMFILSGSLTPFIFFAIVSLITWSKPNWTATSLVFGSVIVVLGYNHFIYEKKSFTSKIFIIAASIIALLLNILFYIQPLYPETFPELSRADSTIGWKRLAERVLDEIRTMPPDKEVFIAGNGYEISSEMKFYTKSFTVYSCNTFREPALAYDYWEDPNNSRGSNAIVISSHYKDLSEKTLNCFFDRVEEKEPFIVKVKGCEIRKFRLFRCFGYKGR